MNWFQKAALPDRFKDMTPAQIEEEFKKLEEERAAIAAAQPVKPEDTPEFKSIQTQLAETQAKLQELEARPTVQPTVTSNEPPKRTSFLEDEDRAFAERVTPIVTQTFQNGSTMARQIARQELLESSDPWDKASNEYILKNYAKEVDDLYAGMPLNVRQDTSAFKNVVGVVKSRHFGDVIKSLTASRSPALFESAGGGGSGSGPTGAPAGPEKELTPGELHAARKMNIKPADYLAAKKKLRITQETGGYAQVRTD